MYQLPFRLADEPEEVQHAVQELPPDHFLNRVPANFLSQSANISSEQHPAAWNAAYHGGSLASADFDIDVATGFVPAEPPLTRLSGDYEVWESAWDASRGISCQSSNPAGERWRFAIRELPVLSTTDLTSLAQLRRAHLILSFLAHRYVHAADPDTLKLIPEPISRPWLQVCERLDMPPILTYSDTVLYNWTLIDPERGISSDNLNMVTSFTSTPSEEHFYFVSLLIELQGAAALRLMATSLDELFVNDLLAHQRITQNLLGLSDVLDDLSQIFETMRNDCEPDVFYNDIRPWFNGGEFILDLGKSEPSQTQNYGGPSAGQSTVIHALDVFLGVDHRPRSDANQSFDDTFMQRMSAYMPHHHRLFLTHLSAQSPSLRSVILTAQASLEASSSSSSSQSTQTASELCEAYDAAIDALTRLRQVHTNIVYRYIILPSRKAQGIQLPDPEALRPKERELKGTGGTNLVTFLRSTRQRTMDARTCVART